MVMHLIARVPVGEGGSGRALGVARAGIGAGPEERITHLLAPEAVPAATALVLLWRGDPLAMPDTVALLGAEWTGARFAARIELRCFDGTLHVNAMSVPLVEIALGTLAPGRYEADVAVTTLAFSDLDHPEAARPVDTEHCFLAFQVA